MGEPEALQAIRNKCVTIDSKQFAIEKEPHGGCDGCYYIDKECQPMARHICCTGGHILKLSE